MTLRCGPTTVRMAPVDGLVDLLMAEAGAGKRDRGHRHVPVKGLHGKGVTGRHGPPRRGRLGAGASGRQGAAATASTAAARGSRLAGVTTPGTSGTLRGAGPPGATAPPRPGSG